MKRTSEPSREGMIRKNRNRFSEKIMLNKEIAPESDSTRLSQNPGHFPAQWNPVGVRKIRLRNLRQSDCDAEYAQC
jgi:hypothetical protein